MAVYKTHTGLQLVYDAVAKDDFRVRLVGDQEKLLYRGPSFGQAMAVYNETKAHYEQRKKDET